MFLFLLEGGSKTVDASITVKEERTEIVGDRVPIRIDQDWAFMKVPRGVFGRLPP